MQKLILGTAQRKEIKERHSDWVVTERYFVTL